MKRTKYSILTLLVLVSLVLAACGGNNSGDSKDDGKDVVEITLWNNNDTGRTYYPKLIEEFEKEHDNIKIKLTNLTAETEDAVVQTAISDNSLPDIFNQNAYRIDELVDLDLIRDLNEVFPEEEQEKYADGVFEEGQAMYEGDVYLFPKYKGSVYLMFYNKEVLEEYGVENPPETWDELIEIGEKIQSESGGSQYGLIFGGDSTWLLSDMTRTMATELSPEVALDYHTGTYSYANEGYIKSIELLKDMLDNKIVSPTSLEVINEVALEYFANGHAAFLIDGNWTGALLHDFGFDNFGVVEIPKFEKGGQHYKELAIGSNDGLYVNKETEHWDEIKLFLEFLKENLYEEMVNLGTAVGALNVEHIENFNPPFDELENISNLFNEVNVTAPDPLVLNPETNKVSLETRKNLPDTNPGAITAGFLTGQVTDLEAELKKYEDSYNESFTNALEKVDGVEREDFIFPNWVPYENYTNEDYEELE